MCFRLRIAGWDISSQSEPNELSAITEYTPEKRVANENGSGDWLKGDQA